MDRRLWRAYLAIGAVAVGGYLLLPTGLPSDLGYLAIGASSGLAILFSVRAHRPARARAWQLMAGGELLWVLGDAVDTWYDDVQHSYPAVSAADVLYLAAYPVLAAGLILLIRNGRRDWPGLLDSAIVTAGLGLLSWVLVARPTLLDSTEAVGIRLVEVAYPAGDILLLALLIRLVSMPGARSAAFRLLAAALALVILADTGYAYATLHAVDPHRLLDVLWLASYLAWGAAALHPSSRSLAGVNLSGARAFGTLRLIALTSATLIAPGTLGVELARGTRLDGWAIVGSSIALFGLVVARMRLALAEIAKANQQKDTLQDELAYEAAHDYLTRLPNRSQAVRQIEAALFRAQRAGSMIGLLFIDLDHFKIVNDTFGHRAGDEVLREVATRMAAQVRGGDMVARLGGDEFVVLLEPIDAESSVVELGERIIRAVSAPIATGGRHVLIGASVGVAVSLDGGTNADHLLGEADAAAYRAKSNGRGRVEVFDGALRRELSDRAVLETAILTGLREDEFELHYQPVVDLEREQVLGFEALIRWNRPGFGLVYPDEFIPTAEHSQLICDLGRWVLAQATRQLSQAENRSLTVAVNISGRHLASAHVLDDVRAALTHSGLDPRRLTLELTETMIIDDPTATDHLRALRDLGVSISIDDFGTGYTSISQLRHLPVDSVKIDRSFMAAGAPNAGELVSLMVNAAHAFGLFVIAEGVEQPAQLTRLREIGCDGAQGYLLGRPLPAQAIPALAETAALR